MKTRGKVWNKLYEQTLERAAASPLMYGLFALETQNESLIVGAKLSWELYNLKI